MNLAAKEIMKKKQHTNFIWCPVCMVHTYHKKEGGKWVCLSQDHSVFLRLRDDPWIDDYRKSQATAEISAKKVS